MDTVSGEVLESVSKEERKRQEAIFEVIQTEDYFVRDMEYIHEVEQRYSLSHFLLM